MADLKEFAEQLVNLTVKKVVELSKLLEDEYGCAINSSYVFHDYETKQEYFVPKKFAIKNPFVDRRYLSFSHRKII